MGRVMACSGNYIVRLLCRSCDGHVTAVSFLFLCNQIKNLINMTRGQRWGVRTDQD